MQPIAAMSESAAPSGTMPGSGTAFNSEPQTDAVDTSGTHCITERSSSSVRIAGECAAVVPSPSMPSLATTLAVAEAVGPGPILQSNMAQQAVTADSSSVLPANHAVVPTVAQHGSGKRPAASSPDTGAMGPIGESLGDVAGLCAEFADDSMAAQVFRALCENMPKFATIGSLGASSFYQKGHEHLFGPANKKRRRVEYCIYVGEQYHLWRAHEIAGSKSTLIVRSLSSQISAWKAEVGPELHRKYCIDLKRFQLAAQNEATTHKTTKSLVPKWRAQQAEPVAPVVLPGDSMSSGMAASSSFKSPLLAAVARSVQKRAGPASAAASKKKARSSHAAKPSATQIQMFSHCLVNPAANVESAGVFPDGFTATGALNILKGGGQHFVHASKINLADFQISQLSFPDGNPHAWSIRSTATSETRPGITYDARFCVQHFGGDDWRIGLDPHSLQMVFCTCLAGSRMQPCKHVAKTLGAVVDHASQIHADAVEEDAGS